MTCLFHCQEHPCENLTVYISSCFKLLTPLQTSCKWIIFLTAPGRTPARPPCRDNPQPWGSPQHPQADSTQSPLPSESQVPTCVLASGSVLFGTKTDQLGIHILEIKSHWRPTQAPRGRQGTAGEAGRRAERCRVGTAGPRPVTELGVPRPLAQKSGSEMERRTDPEQKAF